MKKKLNNTIVISVESTCGGIKIMDLVDQITHLPCGHAWLSVGGEYWYNTAYLDQAFTDLMMREKKTKAYKELKKFVKNWKENKKVLVSLYTDAVQLGMFKK